MTSPEAFSGEMTYKKLDSGDYVVQMPLLISGLLGPKQHRMLPLRLMGSCVIELELDEVHKWATQNPTVESAPLYCNDVELSEARILVDELVIDPALDNEIVQKVSSGTPIPLVYNTFITSLTSFGSNGNDAPTILMSRALSRLRQLFCTFGYKTDSASTGGESHIPFTSSMYMPKGGNPSVRVHIGSQQYPLKGDIDSVPEFLYRLQLAMGSHDSDLLNHGISRTVFEGNKTVAVGGAALKCSHDWISCIDFEKTPSRDTDTFTNALNTRDSPLISVQWKGLGTTHAPGICLLSLYCTQILEIGFDSVTILE